MRGLLGVSLLTGFALAFGGDATRSNALTPKEAAEGWLLLFDGTTSFGWTASAADKLTVKDGALGFTGAGNVQTTTAFHEYALEFQCRVKGTQTHDDASLVIGGKAMPISLPKVKDPGWMQGKLIVADKRYRFTLGGNRGELPVVTGTFDEDRPGAIAFRLADGVGLELRDVMLVPLGYKALFNGKNLDGWKEFAGKQSKFTVNDKLELNVKNGPGDLQTLGKYGDFLLQLDCFSNGEHLNSGIFFRCREGEYQNGYEAQIHNGFTLDPPKKYTVEEYDPQTHKLIGKKTVLSAANDFGTGAIYRRVPARKGVAKDNEWFTMTVVAHGNHFATWVNGIQVVDWTDNRPVDSNPRNGYRADPGHISIQGHDKTTDLNFRNFKIDTYPAAKK
jgi:hypothetical protein